MKLPKFKINKREVSIVLVIALTSSTVLLLLLAGLNAFFNQHYFVFQSPVLINVQSPILLKNRELISPLSTQSAILHTVVAAAEPTPTPTPLANSRTDSLLAVIHFNESNNGKAKAGHHMDCRASGKINEWGWFPSGNRDFCFNNREEGEITIKQFISKRINLGWSNNQILCYYNTGKLLSTCAYAVGNLSEAN